MSKIKCFDDLPRYTKELILSAMPEEMAFGRKFDVDMIIDFTIRLCDSDMEHFNYNCVRVVKRMLNMLQKPVRKLPEHIEQELFSVLFSES